MSDGATFPNLAGEPSLGNTGFPWIGAASIAGLPVPVWLMAVLAGLARCSSRRGRRSAGTSTRSAATSGRRCCRA